MEMELVKLKGVSTDYLKVRTQSGDLETSATFTNAFVSTMSGDVKLCINAREEISTMSGDIKIK